jgi:hypothetical protein
MTPDIEAIAARHHVPPGSSYCMNHGRLDAIGEPCDTRRALDALAAAEATIAHNQETANHDINRALDQRDDARAKLSRAEADADALAAALRQYDRFDPALVKYEERRTAAHDARRR